MFLVLIGKFLFELCRCHRALLFVREFRCCSILVKDSNLGIYHAALGFLRSTQGVYITFKHHTRDAYAILLEVYHQQQRSIALDKSLFAHDKPNTEHTAVRLVLGFKVILERFYHILAVLHVGHRNSIVNEETARNLVQRYRTDRNTFFNYSFRKEVTCVICRIVLLTTIVELEIIGILLHLIVTTGKLYIEQTFYLYFEVGIKARFLLFIGYLQVTCYRNHSCILSLYMQALIFNVLVFD